MTTTTAQGQKRTYDPEGMRARLLDVAAVAFQSRGYHSTGMHDIMRDADTSGGALYHHFPTKKALGLAVIQERVAKTVDETWIQPIRSARSASAGIRAVFSSIIAELDEQGGVQGCPLNNLVLELSLSDPDFRISLHAIFEKWRAAIAERLRSDQALGRSSALDPESFATLVVATFSGAMAMAKANQSTEPLKACARQIARVLTPRRAPARR